ncbi:MAG: SGNH/GDSL hydrolase family protein [Oscillospiraceae bacterium]|nr:SGNH/GDSL hydrolase family protein [Oscillospiraceae bacterium]
MKLREKFCLDAARLLEDGPITVVALGDSVTHGALGFESTGVPGTHYETVYWNRLRRMLQEKAGNTPVNLINAGIGGTTAKQALPRLRRQVLDHHPDLVIVCFGLNDVNYPPEEYVSSLKSIFRSCLDAGTEVIFMTPNMLNTSLDERVPAEYREYAVKTAEMQNGGRMDRFMDAARAAAAEEGVPVCDCYARWKELSKERDITGLLANWINHPTAEMHSLFAESLFDMIMA